MNIRSALSVFNEEALIALASKGLYRRALKAVENGSVNLINEQNEQIELRVADEIVLITEKGPAHANCTCPALKICQHKISATLFLVSETIAETDNTSVSVSKKDPRSEILDLSEKEISKWAGKDSLSKALELIKTSTVEIETTDTQLKIRLGDNPEMLWLSGQGLSGMISKLSPTNQKVFHTAAVLAIRSLEGKYFDTNRLNTEANNQAVAGIDQKFLQQVRKTLEQAAQTAIAMAPQALEERLFALAVSSRADNLPRLSANLRTLAKMLNEKRAHQVFADDEGTLQMLATTYALTIALENKPDDSVLCGQIRRKYLPVNEDIQLIGMGASAWQTKSGARGVTAYFYQPDSNHWFTTSISRTGSADANFNPVIAYQTEYLWNAGSLEKLCKTRLTLKQAMLADSRLSGSQKTRAETKEANYDLETINEWPAIFQNWGTLRNSLCQRESLSLSSSINNHAPVILAPSMIDRPYLDENRQLAIWPIADQDQSWLGLAISVNEEGAHRLQMIEHYIQSINPRLILATASIGDSDWRLTPYAILALKDKQLQLFNLDFDNLDESVKQTRWWKFIEKKKTAPGLDLNNLYYPAINTSMTDRLLATAMDLAITTAQFGASVITDKEAQKAVYIAQKLELAGLGKLSDLIQPLKVQGTIEAKALLSLVYALTLTKQISREIEMLYRRK